MGESKRVGSRWSGWIAAFVGATLLTVLFPTQHHVGGLTAAALAERLGRDAPQLLPWSQYLLGELPVWYGWLLISVPIVWFCRRYPLAGENRVRNILFHLPVCCAALTAHVLLITAVRHLYVPISEEIGYFNIAWLTLSRYWAFLTLTYIATVAIYHAGVYYSAFQDRRVHAARLQTQLANAQLDILKMQLHPHFLFNTLNTISSLTVTDAPAAQNMIVQLSDLLRLSLERSARHEVPLREELRFLEKYVEIQRMRFHDRLRVSYQIDREAEPMLVPRLVLQPLVENAIRHGIEKNAGAGHIQVSAARENGRLHLEVNDNGPGMNGKGSPGTSGIGLQNTQERLRQLYPGEHVFRIDNLQPSGLVVRITIPARTLSFAPEIAGD